MDLRRTASERRPNRFALLLVALLSFGGVACSAPPPANGEAKTQTVSSTLMTDTATITVPLVYAGQVYVEHDVVVAARSAGVIDTLLVNLGSVVRVNDLLATIESRDQEIAQSRAAVEWERARNAVQRSRELTRSGGVTAVDSEQLEFDFRTAELDVQATARALALTRIVAPVRGVVTARYAKPQQLVAVGDTLFRVVETTPQLVRILVPEPAAKQIRIGGHAVVVSTSGSLREPARVAFASPVLDPASGTREVILQIASPKFMNGESVSVEIGSENHLAVVAPRAAIAPEFYALVMDGERSTVRPVTLGIPVGKDKVEIVSGLTAGERLAPWRR